MSWIPMAPGLPGGGTVRFLPGLFALVLFAGWMPTGLSAQLQLSPEHERIGFLVGEWRTTSEFPDGRVGEGDLEYRWVFEGRWMRVEFHGSHPQGTLWEAHVMQRWNPETAAYEAWVFPAEGPPLRYRGSSSGPGHFRVEYTADDGVTIGIDYHEQDDGSVFQENWRLDGDERTVTLRTTYAPRGG
jgi:hypothetical protein